MVAALAALALAAAAPTGVAGTALIDPGRPVCRVGEPCTRPDGHEQLAFWRSSTRVAVVTTRADGTFRVALAPGLYRVTLPRRTGYVPRLTPAQVRVPRTGLAHVTFHVDIGIR